MTRILFTLALGVGIGAAGMGAVQQDAKPNIKLVVKRDIAVKVDGKETAASVVEVTLEPGQQSPPHRHPGVANDAWPLRSGGDHRHGCARVRGQLPVLDGTQ